MDVRWLSLLAAEVAALLRDLGGLGPELWLSGAWMVLLGLVLGGQRLPAWLVPGWTLVAIAGGGLLAALAPAAASPSLLGMIQPDASSRLIKGLVSFSALVVVAYAWLDREERVQARRHGEYFLFLLALILGIFLLSMATHLLLMYLAVELISISSYLLTGFRKSSGFAAEASIKYLLFGAFASALTIYGISWLYGLTGSFRFTEVTFLTSLNAFPAGVQVLVLGLVVAGLLFKVGAVPFHFWAPDAYQGASYPVAAFFSVAPKAGGVLMLMRLLEAWDTAAGLPALLLLLGLAAAASMTLGNLAALGQPLVKRLLAYSSIAQAGYLLAGVICLSSLGRAAVLFYLLVYVCMNLGAFLLAGHLSARVRSDALQDLAGTGRRQPWAGTLMAILMLALTGLPPTAGFTGKWYLVLAIWEQTEPATQFFWLGLLICLVVNTVVSLFYYLRLPIVMIFRSGLAEASLTGRSPRGPALLIGLLTLPVLVLGVFGFDRLLSLFQLWVWN
jgi:NADH-quinone oxidoreductase subunit N